MADITGGCLRGNVRYGAKGEPLFQAVCHCTHCQRQAGTFDDTSKLDPKVHV